MGNLKTNLNKRFWKNKKILITGVTGFKGSWLSLIFYNMGLKITGIGLDPPKNHNLFNLLNLKKKINYYKCNINNKKNLNKILKKINPDIIFHFAAQSLVIEGYKHPIKTYKTNIIGSSNLFECILNIKKKMHILITTTDKVYKNQSLKKSFSEKDTLGGNDPYSASKAALEVICDYYNYKLKNNNKILNIARSGNVIGGGDFSKDRIFPDIYKSIKNKTTLSIRNPNSVRPWQHVLEPLYGYLRIVEKSNKTRLKSNAFNFGPHNNQSISVKEILKITQTFYPRLKYQIKAKQEFYESSYLFLNSALVKKYIFYEQIWNINKTVSKTINWYLDFLKKKDVLKISIQDINDFEKNF